MMSWKCLCYTLGIRLKKVSPVQEHHDDGGKEDEDMGQGYDDQAQEGALSSLRIKLVISAMLVTGLLNPRCSTSAEQAGND